MTSKIKRIRERYQWLLMVIGALLTATMGTTLYYSRSYVQERAMETAVNSLRTIVNDANVNIHKIQQTADGYISKIEQHLDNPEQMFVYSREILECDSNLKGCSISFEPFFFKDKGRYFSAYSYNRGDSIVSEQEGDDGYQYFCMDWYLIPRQLNKKYWIEPFEEYNTDGIIVKEVMTSYCQPFHDDKGNIVGVLSADVPLKWLSDSILTHHPFPHSYCMLLGRGGTFIVHPDSTRLLTEGILTPTLEGDDPDLLQLGRAIIDGHTGQQALKIDGVESHVFYMPFDGTGWSLALVCPDIVLMKKYYLLAWSLVVLMFFTIILMLTPLWNLLSRRSQMAQKAVVGILVLTGLASCAQKEKEKAEPLPATATAKPNSKLAKARDLIASYGIDSGTRFFIVVDSLEDAGDISEHEADYWRADRYYEMQKLRSAALYYKKAVDTDELKHIGMNFYYNALQGLYTTSFNSSNIEDALATATRAYQEAIEDTTVNGQTWAANYQASIGSSLLKLGNLDEAAKNYAAARETVERLAIANPDDEDVQETCLIIAGNIINNYLNRRDFASAEPWLRMMEQSLERLAATGVSMKVYEHYLANTLSDKAVILYKTGHEDEAETAYQGFLNTGQADSYGGIYDQAYYLEVTEQWDKLLKIQLKIDSAEMAEGIPPTIDYLIESPATTFKALVMTGRSEEALRKAERIILLLDSAKELQHRSDAEELAAIYETQQKEEQITQQQKELSKQQSKLFHVVFVLMIIFFVVYTRMRLKASRRFGKMKAAQERIEGELQIARDIQMSMVPHKFPEREGLDMYAAMTPAREVGGDLYGYVVNGQNLYFCLGDVSGKGVPASLFMAQATSLFRTLASQGMKPAEICTRMNDALTGDNNENGMFVTFFLGLVDLQTGHLSFCNAGHNPPVIGGNPEHGNFLKMETNAPIGLWSDLKYIGEEIKTIKNCPLFLYTDGLNEAENRHLEQFGEDRLLSILRNTDFENARQVIDTLSAAVEKHRDGAEPNDDLTMMCIMVK